MKITEYLIRSLKKAFMPEGFNFGINIGKMSFLLHLIHKAYNPLIKHAVGLFIVVSLLVAATPLHGLTINRVLAIVNNEEITLSDYQRFATGIGENKDVVVEALLKRLIEERIILHEAIRRGIDVSDMDVDKMIREFKEQNALSQEDLEKVLAERGLNIHSYRKLIRDRMIISKLANIDLDSKIVVTDKEIKDFYNANKKDYFSPEKVELMAIFLKLSKDASVTEITNAKRMVLRINSKLKDGESFEKLINQYSDEPLKSQGGRLGEFVRGTLSPLLNNKAFSMKKGEISEPIWVSEGVYILQLANRTSESLKTVGEVKEEIHKRLYEQKLKELYNKWIKALWGKASVTIK